MTRVQLSVGSRFCGPPTSSNGGYVCGLIAAQLSGAVEVTLRQPPPLDTPLMLEHDGTHGKLRDEQAKVIAEVRVAPLALDPPAPPDFETAIRCAETYIGHAWHPYPTCFTCGPARGEGDGLRIFTGRWTEDWVAAPWIPDASVSGEDRFVEPAVLWAAMDCPGYFAVCTDETALLGRLHGETLNPVEVGDHCTVVGWCWKQAEGRKRFPATALYDGKGTLCGQTQQTWIVLN